MALDIRIAQFFKLTAARNRDGTIGQTHYYQNYFANENKTYSNESYSFAPFQAQGTTAA